MDTYQLKKLQEFKEMVEKQGCAEIIDELRNGEASSFNTLEKIIEQIKSFDEVDGNLVGLFYKPKYMWGACYMDLSGIDLSGFSKSQLLRMGFSNRTVWPQEDKLPSDFNPDEEINNAKKFKGLGIQELHDAGLVGKGTTIAYIDTPFDIEHVEFSGLDTQYKPSNTKAIHFHGAAVSSRCVGQNMGIAPKSKYLYYEFDSSLCNDYNESSFISLLNALKDIIERVKMGQRVDVIGVSASPLFWLEKMKNKGNIEPEKLRIYKEEYDKLIGELKELNIAYVDSSVFFNSGFSYSFMEDPTSSHENVDNYMCQFSQDSVSVVEAGRCVPCMFDRNNYKYENQLGSASWSIPQIVGMFALARQIDEQLKFDDFVVLAHETAYEPNIHGARLINPTELMKKIQLIKNSKIESDSSN